MIYRTYKYKNGNTKEQICQSNKGGWDDKIWKRGELIEEIVVPNELNLAIRRWLARYK